MQAILTKLKDNFKTYTSAECIEQLNKELYNSVRFRFEFLDSLEAESNNLGYFKYLDTASIGRVILTNNNRTILKKDFYWECNGLVVDSKTWRIIVRPPKILNDNLTAEDAENIKTNVKKCNIIKINDGTSVSLYYWNNEWCISSKNYFDIRNYTHLDKTIKYNTAIEEVLLSKGITLESLNKNYSYTIGFTHPKFHPYSKELNVWLIHVYDHSVQQFVECDINLVKQESLKETITIKTMQLNNESMDYCMKNQHYGYIIQSPTQNYILRSILFATIKQFMYEFPKKHLINLNYITLRGFLVNKYLFKQLFPQFIDNVNKLEVLFEKIYTNIISKKIIDHTNAIILDIENLIKTNKLNTLKATDRSIISDFIYNSRNLDFYYSVLYPI